MLGGKVFLWQLALNGFRINLTELKVTISV